jgi:hypothetical protein
MATETWVVDGVNLTDLAYDIVTFDGLDDTPPVDGGNIPFAQSHGEIWVPKYYRAAQKQIVMYVSSKNNSTGVQPSDIDSQRANVDMNLDRLVSLFMRRRKLLTVVRTLSSGQVRQAFCECTASIAPNTIGLADSKISVVLTLPSGFWEDQSSGTMLSSAPGTNLVVSGAANATAPMTDLTYAITGPATNPKVVDVESGSYFQYNGVIAAGTTMTINPDMTVTNGTLANMVHVGDVNWLTLHPVVDITAVTKSQVTFTASSTTAATRLTITGKRKYLR